LRRPISTTTRQISARAIHPEGMTAAEQFLRKKKKENFLKKAPPPPKEKKKKEDFFKLQKVGERKAALEIVFPDS